ncbi:MAG: hypothetical protein FJ265_14880 [Planctomycetes bacterium]|nr:hypothetical protein [Planctomycetota bacterium]
MVARRIQDARVDLGGGLRPLVALACAWLAACSGPGPRSPRDSARAAELRELLGGRVEVVVRELPPRDAPLALPAGGCLVVGSDGWREVDGRLGPGQLQALRDFLARGGAVLLFGYAAQLAADAGVETERPESAPFRWGFDARTAIGRARLGLGVVSGRLPELFDGLVATGGEDHFLLAGGQPCSEATCLWAVGEPRSGVVLARLLVELDGAGGAPGAPVLVHWRAGPGEVLACGLVPGLDGEDPTVRENARRFLRNCVATALRGRPGPVVVYEPPRRGGAPVPAADRRELPAAPLLAHWGWRVPIRDAAGTVRSAEELVEEVLLPSWLQGADLLGLDLGDRGGLLPLPWDVGDPLRPPAGYRPGAPWPGWSAATPGWLVREAHARGMLVHAGIAAFSVGERPAERFALLRFLARELACLRRLGDAAIDGFVAQIGCRDGSGVAAAMVEDFRPGGAVVHAGEAGPVAAGALRALDADDGAVPRLGPSGLSASWRDGFPADLFPFGVLDAREVRPDRAGTGPGGGSFPDWIVQQANDFVRERRGAGGALWWRAHDPATLGPRTVAYVHGVSMEPLRAAVAMPLAATGAGGYRAAAAALLGEAQPGFGAATEAPAAVCVLQNNWFRLDGSGGALWFDPTGSARFGRGQARALAHRFVRTRLSGGRPDAELVRGGDIDFLQAGQRGEGGYPETLEVDAVRGAERQLPAVLAGDGGGRWPARVAVAVEPGAGYHELQLLPRAVRGQGILTVALDGAVLRCVPFAVGVPGEQVVVPVHVANDGERRLWLEVAEGGAVALDRLRLVRAGDVGAEARIDVPAGSLAQLAESSASSYHKERLELRTLADFPGFLLRSSCSRAARNLQVERTFQFAARASLLRASGGEAAARLRAPFLLRLAGDGLPDVLVAPLRLWRHDHFALRDGLLQLACVPEPGHETRVGFLLCARGEGEPWLAAATAVFAALDEVQELELGDGGEALLVNDLAVTWPRLLHLRQRARTPYAVLENGWWTWRAAQPADGGGDLLRVVLQPGDPVRVVGGPALFARTRPAAGSLSVLALREPGPRSVTARVHQPSRLGLPGVVMAEDFTEVLVDGAPWSAFDGRTVWLPDRAGTYRIETQSHRGALPPHVARTGAPLRQCRFLPERRELLLVADADPARPVELPFTAVLRGPRPRRGENGEVVDDAELRFPDAEARAAAAAGGVLIRFRPGVTRVWYGD